MLKRDPEAVDSPIVGTVAASAVIMACGLVTGLIAARSLGPNGRGQLAALTVWTITFQYAGDFGLPDAVAYVSGSERRLRDRVWTTAQALAIAFGLLITLVGWWIVPFVFTGDNEALVPGARWYLTWFVVPSLGVSVALAWLHGVGRMRAFNLSRSTVQLVNAAGMMLLFIAGDDSVLHFAAVLLVGNAAAWCVAASFGPGRQMAAAPPSAPLARRMLGYGLRMQYGNWSNVANVRLDQLLLSLFTSATSLGLYVVAVNYAMLLQAMANTAGMAMWPGMVAAGQAGDGPAYVTLWYRRLLWLTLAAAVVLAAASAFIIPVLIGPAFSSAVPIAVLLVLAVVFLGMNEILLTAFRGIGRPDIASASQVIGLAVTVVALTVLLPRWGVYGAAAASLLSYGSTHAYLLRRTVVTFGISMTSLIVLTRKDLDALRTAGVSILRRDDAASPRPAE